MASPVMADGLRQRMRSEQLSEVDFTQNEDVQLKKFVETNGHFSLVRNFRLADVVTLMNGFCGAQSIFMSGRYLATSNPTYIWYALWFPFFGAIFDLLDGKVARWRQSSSMLGQELDSLADSISFGVAPAFIAFSLGLRLPLDTFVLTLFVCAGVARLARFNITAATVPHTPSGKAQYFEGLPIPSSLVLVGCMALCLLFGRFELPGGAWVPKGELLPFTGRWHNMLSTSSLGVPLGVFTLDFSESLYKLLTTGDVLRQFLSKQTIAGVANWAGRYSVHKITLLWLAWAIAMVSKTLRVPKP
ncbi:CDP-diacylglycerol--serine O-phosphatidyltransferase [Malassezia vespertilionis]|uniref:CDP-diacylglycerol--serine O-phosphatidyltransferase n=1 Tax=Malassezia vespertilionis TaxID=2020962 RepID=A0A2N1JGU1_9BASI|nr:CDP-diacylglycerol--serine O-phosphatidyltransferase [Malassezia vespertilionis]PKI85761.1 Cho1p [Malassezia vespertilionis]WFD04709.1 CDP-diacylglycerol--serine O-phosphatidyltransferase [Malassezia vespertilionis]